MKIVVPYTKLHPTTEFVLRDYNPHYVELRGSDAYRLLLRSIWRRGEPVIIVEHDIVPWPGALEELWACPCSWGAYSYHMHGGVGIFHGLGCTKLSSDLMAKTPDIWDEPCPWNLCDQHLLRKALAVGLEPHHHRPAVTHLSEFHTAR